MDWNQKVWRRSIEGFPEFMEPLVAELGRSERREGAALYVQGLLMPGARKSVEPLAERLGVDSQKLQQFIADSPWDDAQVWAAIRRDVVPVLEPLAAWIIDETGWLKQGDKSVGSRIKIAAQSASELPGQRGGGGERRADCRASGGPLVSAGKVGQRQTPARSGRGASSGAVSNQASDRGGLG